MVLACSGAACCASSGVIWATSNRKILWIILDASFLTWVQVHGTEAPTYDDPKLQNEFAHLQQLHTKQQAQRALVEALRVEMKRHDTYTGSKLELMDKCGVKLTEFSSWPVYLAYCGHHKQPRQARAVTLSVRATKKRPAAAGDDAEFVADSAPAAPVATRHSTRQPKPVKRDAEAWEFQ